MISQKIKIFLLPGLALLILSACSTANDQQSSREIASAPNANPNSCESPEKIKWFDGGKYSVVSKPVPSGRWSESDPQSFASYSTALPIKGRVVETWSSAFSKSKEIPKNRDQFFSRGTMYYFEVEGIESPYQSAEDNWRLLKPTIVGADSKIKVYRIDQNSQALNQECPEVEKSQLVGTIPYFSLRTSGNRTNQMPKSSFKVKMLGFKKWKKLADAQYEQYIETLTQAPQEIKSLAKAIQEQLGIKVINGEILKQLQQNSRNDFVAMYSNYPFKLSPEDQWNAGKLRNGLLWWKGQLDDAVSFVDRSDIERVLNTFEEGSENKQILSAFLDRKKNSGWPAQIQKREAKIEEKGKPDKDFLGMNALNLKAMWNDPSQMREALAWYMFEKAGVTAPKQTYAKVCFGKTYRGVFSVVEQVDEDFLVHRGLVKEEEKNQANIYKVYMGTEDVGLDIEDLRKAFTSLDLSTIPNGNEEKWKVINSFIDNPFRGKRALAKSPFAKLSPFKEWLENEEYFFKNIGGGTLLKVNQKDPRQISPYFKAKSIENRTYQLQTDWEENVPAAQYRDLETLINSINSGDYESDSYFERMNKVLDTKSFLKWAALTVLLGGWDNYYMNPQNYYLLNEIPFDKSGVGSKAKFKWIPWDYDQSFSMSFGDRATLWWNTDILDWESTRREKRPDGERLTSQEAKSYAQLEQRPLITNMLKNPRFRSYYLKFIDWMIHNYFHVDNVVSLIGKDFPMTDSIVDQWRISYQPQLESRQKAHRLRIQKEIWDDPSATVDNFRQLYQERMLREISSPENWKDSWFAGLNVKGTDSNLTWFNFQNLYRAKANNSSLDTGVSAGRCDQEPYVEPRSPKDQGQCQETDGSNPAPIYPSSWRKSEPKYAGIWNLIASSVYQEHMGLSQPRWDIMSRTGRQYRNAMVYENGYLGRRIIWKELWQESPEKCEQQFKVFEGIEHHVRERARTALETLNKNSPYTNEAERKKVQNMSLEEITKLSW